MASRQPALNQGHPERDGTPNHGSGYRVHSVSDCNSNRHRHTDVGWRIQLTKDCDAEHNHRSGATQRSHERQPYRLDCHAHRWISRCSSHPLYDERDCTELHQQRLEHDSIRCRRRCERVGELLYRDCSICTPIDD